MRTIIESSSSPPVPSPARSPPGARSAKRRHKPSFPIVLNGAARTWRACRRRQNGVRPCYGSPKCRFAAPPMPTAPRRSDNFPVDAPPHGPGRRGAGRGNSNRPGCLPPRYRCSGGGQDCRSITDPIRPRQRPAAQQFRSPRGSAMGRWLGISLAVCPLPRTCVIAGVDQPRWPACRLCRTARLRLWRATAKSVIARLILPGRPSIALQFNRQPAV